MPDESPSVFRRVDNFMRGAANMLTFGYADRIAARMDSAVLGGTVEERNREQEQLTAAASQDPAYTAGSVTGAVVGVGKVVQAARWARGLVGLGRPAATVAPAATAERSLLGRMWDSTASARRRLGWMAGTATAATVGVGIVAYNSDSPTPPENRAYIEGVNTRRAADPGVQRDAVVTDAQRQLAQRNAPVVAAIREEAQRAGRTLTEPEIAAEVQRRTEAQPARPATQATLIWRDESCVVNGLAPLTTPASSNRFQQLEVACTGLNLARDAGTADRTTVEVQRYRRNAAGQIVFGPRTATGQSLPVVQERQVVSATVTRGPNGEAIAIPADPAFANADNIAVRVVNPSNPTRTVQTDINIGQNPEVLRRFTP